MEMFFALVGVITVVGAIVVAICCAADYAADYHCGTTPNQKRDKRLVSIEDRLGGLNARCGELSVRDVELGSMIADLARLQASTKKKGR